MRRLESSATERFTILVLRVSRIIRASLKLMRESSNAMSNTQHIVLHRYIVELFAWT